MLRYQEVKQAIKEMIASMNNGDRLPSRQMLSRKLDSSRATVSKAIRELIEEGILEARQGSGTYVARRLEGIEKSVKNWCLIVPDITEAIYAKLAGSVECAASERNTNVILCNSENSAEKQSEYIKRLLMAGIDGFIIVPTVLKSVQESVELYQSLIHSKIPFVFCNRDVEGVPAPVVKSNDFYGGYLATLHLLDHGYRNIVFLARQRYRTSIERFQGYISALQHRGYEISRDRIIMIDDGKAGDCYEQLCTLLESEVPVDAVFCFNDVIALEALRAVVDMGLRLSEDVGIIGYDDSMNSEQLSFPLTTVAYRAEDIGRMAAQVLERLTEKKEPEKFDCYLMKPYIVMRQSCLGKGKSEANKQSLEETGK